MKNTLILTSLLLSITLCFAKDPAPPAMGATPEEHKLKPTAQMTTGMIAAQLLQQVNMVTDIARALDSGIQAQPQQGIPAIDAKDLQAALGKENVDRIREAAKALTK